MVSARTLARILKWTHKYLNTTNSLWNSHNDFSYMNRHGIPWLAVTSDRKDWCTLTHPFIAHNSKHARCNYPQFEFWYRANPFWSNQDAQKCSNQVFSVCYYVTVVRKRFKTLMCIILLPFFLKTSYHLACCLLLVPSFILWHKTSSNILSHLFLGVEKAQLTCITYENFSR